MNWSGNFREGLAREIRENKTLAKITAYTVIVLDLIMLIAKEAHCSMCLVVNKAQKKEVNPKFFVIWLFKKLATSDMTSWQDVHAQPGMYTHVHVNIKKNQAIWKWTASPSTFKWLYKPKQMKVTLNTYM